MFQNFDIGPSFGFMKSITIDFKTQNVPLSTFISNPT